MQEEVISDISHHNSSTFSADYNTTEVPTIKYAKGFALHSDPSEACFGGRGEKCGLRSVDTYYMYYRETEKFTLLQFPKQGLLVLLGTK